MKINTHELNMTGLKKAAAETKELKGYYSGSYVQISYNHRTGEVLTAYHYSLGQNSWTQYADSDVIPVCNASKPMTMQAIADTIAEAVTCRANAQ